MGICCGFEIKDYSSTPFPDADTVLQNCEDSKTGVPCHSRNISGASLCLKSLRRSWSKSFLFSYEEDSCEVERNNNDWSEEEDECLAQLWEDCYDITELINKTTDRVHRCEKELIQWKQKSEDVHTCVNLVASITKALTSLGFDLVLQRLQSFVFSTEKQAD